MEDKIQLSELVSYIPHGLKGEIQYSDGDKEISTLSDRDGLNNHCDIYSFLNGTYPTKPILYPCNLTKTIIHNGEEIIPILELAKMVWGKLDVYELHLVRNEIITNYSSMMYEGAVYKTLTYINNSFSFSVLNSHLTIIGHFTAQDQLSLFQKLFEWKFDVFGLIERGLAIDVTNMDINPYI